MSPFRPEELSIVLFHPSGRLIKKDEANKGVVTSDTYLTYARAAGGYLGYFCVLLLFMLPVACSAFINWWLSYWVNQGAGVSEY